MSGGDWKDLYQATESGDLERVRYHISGGINPNYQHPEIMRSPLVVSLIYGHAEIAEYLLENGADPNLLSDMDSMTPLQAARKHGHKELERQLRKRGAKDVRQPFWWRWLPV